MNPRVYLAGPIQGLSYREAVDWREDAIDFLGEHGVDGLSPMRCKEYLREEAKLKAGYDTPMSCARGIVTRDRYDVMNCDIVLAYLKGADEVSIGTCIEIGWADAFRKPVVAVMDEKNYHDHPMLCFIAGFIVPTLEEALHIILAVLNVSQKESVRV